MRKIKVKVTPKIRRLDLFLTHEIKPISRSQIKKLIKEENIKVNGKIVDPNYKPEKGDDIVIEIPPPKPTEVKPENIPLNIVFEDDDLIIIDKKGQIVTHPALDHPTGTLVNALLYHFKNIPGAGDSLRPGIVHRLDKGTSGIMVIAKNEKALEFLKKQFKDRGVTKKYICLVQRRMEKSFGVINAPLARHPRNRMKFTVDESGREAITHYRLIRHIGEKPVRPTGGLSLLEIEPKTGRTHQIRVHLAYVGHPIVGDKLYGGKMIGERQFLHASFLEFTHPITGKKVTFESKLPKDLQDTLDKLSN